MKIETGKDIIIVETSAGTKFSVYDRGLGALHIGSEEPVDHLFPERRPLKVTNGSDDPKYNHFVIIEIAGESSER